MAVFYGIYIEDKKTSAVLDVLRFIAEPDARRYSHITLRGPYNHELNYYQIEQINESVPGDWSIFLSGPGYFFDVGQNTVILRVELNELRKIMKKRDFEDGIAHLTLYDGKDRRFAERLLDICHSFDFYRRVSVSKLRKIDKKAIIEGNSISFYPEFLDVFNETTDSSLSPFDVTRLSDDERLKLIEKVLDSSFERHLNKLNKPKILPVNMKFNFEFPPNITEEDKNK